MSNRAEFLLQRRLGIGGSDVAAVLGLDPHKTRYRLWREKVGLDASEAEAARPAARRGNFLESAVIARYAEIVRPATIELRVAHAADGGWRRGNQDARAIGADGVRRAVECKTVCRDVFRRDWGRPWSDEVPDRALCQGLWYGALDDASIVDFAVCVIPDDPDEVLGLTAAEVVAVSDVHVFQAQRNPAVEQAIIDRARAFWVDHVVANVPPPLSSVEDVNLQFPIHITGATKPAEPIVGLLRRFAELRDHANATKREVEDLRERIMIYAEGSECLTGPDGRTPWLYLRTESRAAHSVAASSARVLRFTKWMPQTTTPNT